MPFLFQSRSLYDNRNQKLKSLFSYFRKNWCLASFKTIFFFTWNDFHFFLVFVSTINQTENSLLCGYDCFCVYVSLIFIFHFPFLTPQFHMFIFMKKKIIMNSIYWPVSVKTKHCFYFVLFRLRMVIFLNVIFNTFYLLIQTYLSNLVNVVIIFFITNL